MPTLTDLRRLAIGRLKWRSKRSQLELDLYFDRFIQEGQLDSLSDFELEAYGSLLDFEDGDLLLFFQKKITVDDENIQYIIDCILTSGENYVKSTTNQIPSN